MKPYICLVILLLLTACTDSATAPADPNRPDPLPDDGSCAVLLSEDITVNSVMVNTASACDYLLTETIFVQNGTLTVEPGTVIKFKQDVSLNIGNNARLIAVGTANQRIRFEAEAPVKGYAHGIYFTSPLESRLEYADLVYLGKEDIGPFASHDAAIDGSLDAGLSLRHVSVSGSIFDGANLKDINLLAFENNVFFDNAFYGLVIDAAQAHKLDAASDYLGQTVPNGRPYILLEGLGSDEEAFESATWKRLNAPYFIDIAVYIVGGVITVEPGAKFVFGEGAGMDIDEFGALRAQGRQDAPIVFTGEQTRPGYWDGLSYFESDSRENLLDYVELRFGGGSQLIEGAISVGLASYLKMTNSIVADSASWGVCVTYISDAYAAIFEEENNTYLNNPWGDVVEDCDD